MYCNVQHVDVDIPNVQDCIAVCTADGMVVAVVLGPALGRKARRAAMLAASRAVVQDFTGRVYVTADLDLYRQLLDGRYADIPNIIMARGNGVCYGLCHSPPVLAPQTLWSQRVDCGAALRQY